MERKVKKENAGQRIDKFLKKEVFFNSEVTRGEIIQNIKNGNVLVNGKKIKPSYILKVGDRISSQSVVHSSQLVVDKNIKFGIIYEDKNIIVVNKPAGISVHPVNFGQDNALVNGLIYKFPEIKNINDGSSGSELRPGIVHRLDKDTSGVMVVARNQKTFDKLKKLFQDRKVRKIYLALVYGQLENKKGLIDKPLAKAADYKKQVVAGGRTKTKIRPAVTEYKVIKEFENYSLIEVKPQTGRTHQIRVHLASIGHPVAGDKIYKARNIKTEAQNIGRQLLHAKELEFELFGKKYDFEVKMPEDFQNFMQLRKEFSKRGQYASKKHPDMDDWSSTCICGKLTNL